MITNNQLIKLKDRGGASIAKARELLLGMAGKIGLLRDLQVEADIRHGAASYDLLMIARYDSLADLEAYITDPVHREVAQQLGTMIESSAVVCYET